MVMMSKEGFTIIVNSMTPVAGILMIQVIQRKSIMNNFVNLLQHYANGTDDQTVHGLPTL